MTQGGTVYNARTLVFRKDFVLKMTNKARFSYALALTIFLTVPCFSEPANLSELKTTLRHYHDSGQYDQEVQAVTAKVQNYIKTRTQDKRDEPHPQKLALVLDIDETCLSNYNRMAKADFGGNKSAIHRHILEGRSPAITPMLRVYQYAIKQGVNVFFVTGRHQSECEKATPENLRRAGFKTWSGLYCRPDTYHAASIIPFKSSVRKLLSEKGYTIIASIGDQYSDFKGGYTEKGFKLPNPYYYLP